MKKFTEQEENAIWGVIQHISKSQAKDPKKMFFREDVFNMIYEELNWTPTNP